jgi:hypothetical protein
MADKEIAALAAASTLTRAELLHLIQGGNSRKATIEQILAAGSWRLAGGSYTSPGIWSHSADGDVATADFAGLAGAAEIMLIARLVTKGVSGVLRPWCSVDNGSSYFTGGGDYVVIQTTGAEASTSPALHATNTVVARSGAALIKNANLNGVPKPIELLNREDDAVLRYFVGSTDDVDAVRVEPSGGGNLTGGTIYCLARH